LAGPITGCSYEGATDWREYAGKRLAPEISGLSPMRGKEYLLHLQSISGTGEEYAHFGVLSLPRGIMTRDRFDCTRCDVLLVNLLPCDPETGFSHHWHAGCCVIILIAYEIRKVGRDDRP
jgi:hypothetical protein